MNFIEKGSGVTNIYVSVGVGPPGPEVSLTRGSPKGEHKNSTRPDDPKRSADTQDLYLAL